ncbi:MAG: hypothetical protein H6573_25645 [Lewinellaceae bacterium]|nr:hypothetical protein [Lewinellaceae bacterium]
MPRYLPDPLHPTILHRHIRIQPPRDCPVDQHLPPLLQQPDQALLLGDGFVDQGGFVREEGGDAGLFGEGGDG